MVGRRDSNSEPPGAYKRSFLTINAVSQISIQPMARFDLTSPVDAIRYYMLLRQQSAYAATIRTKLETLTVESIVQAQSQYPGSWKVPSPPMMLEMLRAYSSESCCGGCADDLDDEEEDYDFEI
jgi:hypothetical protein